MAEGRPRVQGPAAAGSPEWQADPQAAVGSAQVRGVRAQERREGLPGPRQRRPAGRHDQDPVLEPARWHDHPQRRDEEVRLRAGAGSGRPGVTRRAWLLIGVTVAAVLALIGGLLTGADHTRADAKAPPASTAPVQ